MALARWALFCAASAHPVRGEEFERLYTGLRRLARSARTFGGGATSTHYFDNALRPLLRG